MFSIDKLIGWQKYVIAGLGAALLVTGSGWYLTSQSLETCQANRRADASAVRAASKEAEAKALREAREKEAEYAKQASEASANYRALADNYRTAVLRLSSNQRAAGQSSAARIASAATVVDGPGESPEVSPTDVIEITLEDGLICADNTARLQSAQQWAVEVFLEGNDDEDGTDAGGLTPQ